jgi:MFS family permease
MSSVTPLCGRLCQILSPRVFLMASGFIMSTGLFITAIAPELETFLLGRIVTGCGAAGVMTTTIILVLELSSRKRRGLFLGLLSASFTTGITLGAVLAGVVAPTFHWVRLWDVIYTDSENGF